MAHPIMAFRVMGSKIYEQSNKIDIIKLKIKKLNHKLERKNNELILIPYFFSGKDMSVSEFNRFKDGKYPILIRMKLNHLKNKIISESNILLELNIQLSDIFKSKFLEAVSNDAPPQYLFKMYHQYRMAFNSELYYSDDSFDYTIEKAFNITDHNFCANYVRSLKLEDGYKYFHNPVKSDGSRYYITSPKGFNFVDLRRSYRTRGDYIKFRYFSIDDTDSIVLIDFKSKIGILDKKVKKIKYLAKETTDTTSLSVLNWCISYLETMIEYAEILSPYTSSILNLGDLYLEKHLRKYNHVANSRDPHRKLKLTSIDLITTNTKGIKINIEEKNKELRKIEDFLSKQGDTPV